MYFIFSKIKLDNNYRYYEDVFIERGCVHIMTSMTSYKDYYFHIVLLSTDEKFHKYTLVVNIIEYVLSMWNLAPRKHALTHYHIVYNL